MVGGETGRRGRAVLLAFALSGALLLSGAMHTGLARAGSYQLFACHDDAGAVMPADLVAQQAPGAFSLSYFRTWDTCAAGGQGSVNAEVGGCTNCDFGSLGVSYTLAPPAGVSISSYGVRFTEATAACRMIDRICYGGQGEDYAIDSQHTAPNYAFLTAGQGFGGPYVVTASGLDAKYLLFYTGCDATHGPCLGTGTLAALYITGLTAVLDDQTSPSVLGASGPLVSGQPISGTQSVNYAAQDSGGGIYAEHAYLDGSLIVDQVVDSNGGRCADHGTVPGIHSFGYVQPCKTTVHATLNIDTSHWSDGAHRLKIDVEDAAGDRATVFEGTVTSVNARAATAAGASTANVGTGTGTGSAGGAASAACLPAATGAIAVGPTGLGTLSAHLTCGGKPLGSASALVQDDRGLRRQVTTDSAGLFRITTRHPHGHLTVTVAGTTAPIVTQLHAISLAIEPHATTNHHAMTWSGVVTGGHAGMKLLLEVRKGHAWDIFDQTSVNAAGRYRYRYTFRATTGTVRYTFRVVARDGSAVSPSRSILVRG